MSGTKMPAATVITPKVRWLDTASHIVKLELGSILDGSKNGNSAKPAVKIAPTIIKLVPVKLKPAFVFEDPKAAMMAPNIARTGATLVIG